MTVAAEHVGLHNPGSDQMEDHFSPHCCRHWFTTHLRRAGMTREFILVLRGDVRREAIDIYDHIDKKELRESLSDAYTAIGDLIPCKPTNYPRNFWVHFMYLLNVFRLNRTLVKLIHKFN